MVRAQVRAEIEHIQRYLTQLREIERELMTARETRHNIVREWQFSGTPPSRAASTAPPTTVVQHRNLRKGQRTLVDDILQVLQTSDQYIGPGPFPVRAASIAGQSYTLLKQIGRPLTGEEIAAQLQAEGESVNPRSVITALYHYAQDGQLFRRISPKTFGLLEWEQAEANTTSSHGEGEAEQERESLADDQQQ